MATLKGKALVWGVSGVVFTGVITSSTGYIQDFNFTKESQKESLVDANGDTVGLVFFDLKRTITVTVVPSDATTTTQAKANMDTMLPDPGTPLTLADADSAETDEKHTGAYVCTQASLKRSNKGISVIDITMEQYDANDVSVTRT